MQSRFFAKGSTPQFSFKAPSSEPFLLLPSSYVKSWPNGLESGRKLNLRRDLRWVATRTRKFPRKYTQVAKNHWKKQNKTKQTKKTFQGYVSCIRIDCFNNEWTSLNLCWLGLPGQTVKNLRRLAFQFDLDQSEYKSSQVNAIERKTLPNGIARRLKYWTCVYLKVRLVKA